MNILILFAIIVFTYVLIDVIRNIFFLIYYRNIQLQKYIGKTELNNIIRKCLRSNLWRLNSLDSILITTKHFDNIVICFYDNFKIKIFKR